MPLNFLSFMLQYGDIVVKLSQLLNKKFLKEEDFSKPIGDAIKNIIRLHNMGMYEKRDYELARLRMLIKHLEELKHYDENLFNNFRARINKSDTAYFGFRFELAIVVSLIRKNIDFKKTESPDFTVNWGAHKIGIECVSIHIEKQNIQDLINKIEKAIKRKSMIKYCVSRILLFIDATNIYHYSLLRRQLLDNKELKKRLVNVINSTNFSGVVIFVFVLNKALRRFELDYLRIDKVGMDPPVKEFLDYCYPYGSHEIYDFAFPKSG